MSRKRSDALLSLVAEAVELGHDLEAAESAVQEATREFIAARQTLDEKKARRDHVGERLATTEEALGLIQSRDDISADTVAALRSRVG